MMMLDELVKQAVYEATRDAVRSFAPYTAGRCYDFARFGMACINALPNAPRVVLQAGTMQWPRINMADDDGVSSTHFSYMWDADEAQAQLAALNQGRAIDARGMARVGLPEMHIWLALPETQEIVDFSTGLLPQACVDTTNEPWTGPLPPAFVWSLGVDLPNGVRYIADRKAIQLVLGLMALCGH